MRGVLPGEAAKSAVCLAGRAEFCGRQDGRGRPRVVEATGDGVDPDAGDPLAALLEEHVHDGDGAHGDSTVRPPPPPPPPLTGV